MSGASGTPYAASVLRALLAAGEAVDLVVSRASRLTLLDETGIGFRDAHWREDLRRWLSRGADGRPDAFEVPAEVADVAHWAAGDLAAGPSSGSYPTKGMLIVPASTACVAGVALGLSKDLLQRAASVTLKERRKLVVAVRETPLSGQTLKALVSLDEAGAVVLPASPAVLRGGDAYPGSGGLRRGAGAGRGGGAAQAVPPVGGGTRWGPGPGNGLGALALAGPAPPGARGPGRDDGRAAGRTGDGPVGGMGCTRAVGQVPQLEHAGLKTFDRVHGESHLLRTG